jgi:hypothetical protein
VKGNDFDECALNRLQADLGDAPDDSRITVRAGDLRGLLREVDSLNEMDYLKETVDQLRNRLKSVEEQPSII